MASLRRKAAALVLAAGLAGKAAAAPAGKRPQVYAHRGARAFSPENTLPAYKTGLAIGADWMDMDVVLTKDGQVLVGHDPVLNPDIARDAQGRFLAPSKEALAARPPAERAAYARRYAAKNLTLAQLKRFDVGRLNPASAYARFFPDQRAVDGTAMPTLREVVDYVDRAAGGRVGFQIEMKTDPAQPEISADPKAFAAALYKILKEKRLIGRAEIQAFDWRCLYALRKLDSRVRTAYLTSRDNEPGGPDDLLASDPRVAGLWTGGQLLKDFGGSLPRMVKALGGFAWEPEDAELTKDALDEAHRLGLKVVVWTWPEKSGAIFDGAMVSKLVDWGVDGIITDDPGRLDSVLAARGFSLPPRYAPRGD